jgi:uncharacterized Zn finger protein
MTSLALPASARQSEPFAWCPTCRGPRPCTLSEGTTDWQAVPAYTCRECGHVTHDPIIRLSRPAPAEVSPAA